MIYPAKADSLGRLRFDDPELAAHEIARLAGKPLRVEIALFRHRRSDAQNRMGWGHVYKEAVADAADWIISETGLPVFQTRDDVHRFGKLHLLVKPTMTNRGMVDLLGTTTELDTAEYNEYIERLCAKLAQNGVYVPPIGGGR